MPTEVGKLYKCARDSYRPAVLVATFIQLTDKRQMLLMPITMFTGMEQAFLAADFTQVFHNAIDYQ